MTELAYTLCIAPLEIFYSWLFHAAATLCGGYAAGLLLMSLCNAFFFVPLGRLAAGVEAREKEIQDILAPQLSAIRRDSSGAEKHRRIKALYRRYAYHPAYAIRSAFGIALQLPFLFAAYHMLRSLPDIQGKPLLGISDLSSPDQLLWGINLLPLVMTAINLLATWGNDTFNGKAKLQASAVAFLFAILLYNASAALLIFWTINNIISLLKTLCLKYKKLLPHFLFNHASFAPEQNKPLNSIVFSLCCLTLFCLGGLFCPAALYLSDPSFFPEGLYPILLGTSAVTLAAAVPFVFSWLICPAKFRTAVVYLFLAGTTATLLFSFVFTGTYGSLDVNTLSNDALLSSPRLWQNDIAPILISLLFTGCVYYFRAIRLMRTPLFVISCAILCYTGFALFSSGTEQRTPQEPNKRKYQSRTNEFTFSQEKDHYPVLQFPSLLPNYNDRLLNFSQSNPNVLILIMDMFTGGHLDELLAEDKNLPEQLGGFTWYRDTVAVSALSIFSLPAIYGGPQYTAPALNLRNSEKNIEKLNEAYAVLPKNFLAQGYDVSLSCPYNYREELFSRSTRKPYAALVVPKIGSDYAKALGWPLVRMTNEEKHLLSRFIMRISLFRMTPHSLRPKIYDSSHWGGTASAAFSNSMREAQNETAFFACLPDAAHVSTGPGTLKIFYSMLSHVPWHLAEDSLDIVPDPYPATDGLYIAINSIIPEHYFTERHIMRLLLRFFTWMKQNGVYDNTMIILVSDHDGGDSKSLNQAFGAVDDGQPVHVRTSRRYKGRPHALLMVKPLNATGPLQISPALMSNADVPAFACKVINGCPEVSEEQHDNNRLRWHLEGDWRFEAHPEKSFTIHKSHSVRGSMFQQENWNFE